MLSMPENFDIVPRMERIENTPRGHKRFMVVKPVEGKLYYWGSYDNEHDAEMEAIYQVQLNEKFGHPQKHFVVRTRTDENIIRATKSFLDMFEFDIRKGKDKYGDACLYLSRKNDEDEWLENQPLYTARDILSIVWDDFMEMVPTFDTSDEDDAEFLHTWSKRFADYGIGENPD